MRFDLQVRGPGHPETTTIFRSSAALKNHFLECYAYIYEVKPRVFKQIFTRMNEGASTHVWVGMNSVMIKVGR